MPQLFKPYANIIAKVSIVLGAAIPVLLGFAIAAVSRSPYNTKVEVPLNQPVPFSHQHHAFELGIDCRYCHTSVEKSSYAGIPDTQTCMSCHSQIWTNSPLLEPVRQSYEQGVPIVWNKVNTLPEFVHFNHSIHVNRGVQCNQCHGPVQDMQITWKDREFQMQWCLECHRAPEKYLMYRAENGKSPRQQVFDMYWKIQERGTNGLSPRELSLAMGNEMRTSNPDEIHRGREIVNELGVKVQQLSDCWVCHY